MITYVTNVENTYQQIQLETLSLLEVGDLKVNNSKAELYEIPKPPPPLPLATTFEVLLAHKNNQI